MHLLVPHYPADDLGYCYEDGRAIAVHESFDLILPTRTRRGAIEAIERQIHAQRDQLWEHHGHYACDLGGAEVLDTASRNLSFTYYGIMTALDLAWEERMRPIATFMWRESTNGWVVSRVREMATAYS